MTIITHNAPRGGLASPRDNIDHKYAKQLLSFANSSCILLLILDKMRLFYLTDLDIYPSI